MGSRLHCTQQTSPGPPVTKGACRSPVSELPDLSCSPRAHVLPRGACSPRISGTASPCRHELARCGARACELPGPRGLGGRAGGREEQSRSLNAPCCLAVFCTAPLCPSLPTASCCPFSNSPPSEGTKRESHSKETEWRSAGMLSPRSGRKHA